MPRLPGTGMHIEGASIADILAAQPVCPVCGCDAREPCDLAPPAEVSPYTHAVAAAVGATVTELLAAAPLWTCVRCLAAWRDPWMTAEAAAWLYGEAAPMHRYGWYSVEHWLKRKPSILLTARAGLWRLLRDRCHHPLSYAEFNCPFGGLVLDDLTARYGDGAREAVAWRIRQIRQTGDPSPIRVAGGGPGILAERTLLLAETPMCWGDTCARDGVPCRALAAGLMFDRTVSIDTAEAAGERFDLLGSFLTLDHMPDPSRTLVRLLRLGKRVLLELHRPGWSDFQHLYEIHPRFIEMVRDNGVHVRDLTRRAHGTAAPTTLAYMLSTDDDLKWLD